MSKVKGHYRKMKNGKKVWIKSHNRQHKKFKKLSLFSKAKFKKVGQIHKRNIYEKG